MSFIVKSGIDENQAEDIFQQVLMLAWSDLDADRMQSDSALPWLFYAARNVASNNKKLRARVAHAETTDMRAATDATFETVVDRSLSDALTQALDALEPLDRRVVELCLEEGLLYKEAAHRLKTSVGTVRNRPRPRSAVITSARAGAPTRLRR